MFVIEKIRLPESTSCYKRSWLRNRKTASCCFESSNRPPLRYSSPASHIILEHWMMTDHHSRRPSTRLSWNFIPEPDGASASLLFTSLVLCSSVGLMRSTFLHSMRRKMAALLSAVLIRCRRLVPWLRSYRQLHCTVCTAYRLSQSFLFEADMPVQ